MRKEIPPTSGLCRPYIPIARRSVTNPKVIVIDEMNECKKGLMYEAWKRYSQREVPMGGARARRIIYIRPHLAHSVHVHACRTKLERHNGVYSFSDSFIPLLYLTASCISAIQVRSCLFT